MPFTRNMDTGVIYQGTAGMEFWWDKINNQPYFYNNTAGEFNGDMDVAFMAFSNVQPVNAPPFGTQATVAPLGRAYFSGSDTPVGGQGQWTQPGKGFIVQVAMTRTPYQNLSRFSIHLFNDPLTNLDSLCIYFTMGATDEGD